MQKLIYSLVLAVLAAALYSGLTNAAFVWNDRQVVFGDDAGGEALTRGRVADAWKLRSDAPFEPLAVTVWDGAQAVARAEGMALPKAFHLLGVAVHVGNVVLVFLILALLLPSDLAAFLGALLFAVHPLHVEAVADVAAFKFVLGAGFALLAIYNYLLFASRRDARGRTRPLSTYYVATASFVLAMLASPAMAVTPLLARLLERLLPKKTSLIATRTPAWTLWTWVALALAPLTWMIRGQSTHTLAQQLPFWAKPVVAADAVSFYLSKVFAPVFIGPDYGRSPAYLTHHWWGFLTWILPVTLLLVLLYWRGASRRWFLIAAGIFTAGLLPYLGLFLFDGEAASTVADRYAYLALLGPALAAAYAVSMPRRRWLPAVLVAATLGAAYLTRVDLAYWQSDAALWSHALSVNPTSPVANATLGDTFRRQGDWEQAREHYHRALETNALTPDIHFYLGEIERQHGDPKKAVAYYQKTLELDPTFAEADVRLGLGELEIGETDAAMTHLRKAVELAPEREEVLRSIGMLYVRKGADAEAIPFLLKALRLGEAAPAPETQALAQTHALLGLAFAHTHQPEVAQGHLEAALRLNPDDKEANRTLADIDYAQAKFELARPLYERALGSGGGDYEAYRNLGLIQARDNQHSKALANFTKALELKPGDVELLDAIGIAHFRMRQLKEAADAFHEALTRQPNQADPHYFLGDIARWQGKEPDAVSEYYKALHVDPNHADANYRLGNYFMKENKITQAIRFYHQALKAQPDDPKLRYSLKRAEQAQTGSGAG